MTPSVLDTPLPREVERTGIYLAILISIPAIVLTVYLVGLMAGLPSVLLHRRLRDHGLAGEAQVVRLYTTQARHGSNGHVAYEFQIGDSRFHQEGIVSDEEFALLRVGDSIPILYEDSYRHRSALNIDDTEKRGIGYQNALIGLKFMTGLILLPVALWVIGWHIAKERQARLLRWGSIAVGRVTGEREYQVRSGTVSQVYYAFETSAGTTVTGTRKSVPTSTVARPEDMASRARLTDSPIVLYDPTNPKRNALYPLVFVKLRGDARLM